MKEVIFVEPFLSYINEEKVLKSMIVTNINKSLIPTISKKPDDKSKVKSLMSHYTSPEYFQNNSNHILIISLFFAFLSLLMVNRGLQFYSNNEFTSMTGVTRLTNITDVNSVDMELERNENSNDNIDKTFKLGLNGHLRLRGLKC